MFLGLNASLLQVTGLGLGELGLLHILEAQLHGNVTVLLQGFLLRHDTGAGLDDGHRNHLAALIEDLGHAHFFADDCFLHVFFSFLGYWLAGGHWEPLVNMTRPSN